MVGTILRIMFFAVWFAGTNAVALAGDTQEVLRTIAQFFNALSDGDVSTARYVAAMRPDEEPLLQTMAETYKAQSQFHEAFKTATGSAPGPGLSMRTGIAKFMPDGEIQFNAQNTAAHCFWGDIPLRRSGNDWKFDLTEYNRRFALTERLAFLRDEPTFWKNVAHFAKSEGIEHPFRRSAEVGPRPRQTASIQEGKAYPAFKAVPLIAIDAPARSRRRYALVPGEAKEPLDPRAIRLDLSFRSTATNWEDCDRAIAKASNADGPALTFLQLPPPALRAKKKPPDLAIRGLFI